MNGPDTVALRRAFKWRDLAPVGAFPLAILFGLNLVDEFDRVAFSTLVPEIRDAVGTTDATIVTVASFAGAFAVMMALPLGYLADRTNRVVVSIGAAALWVFAGIATGLAGSVAIIAFARFAGGSGRLVNDSIHPSLLSDYYPSSSLPFVSAVHRSATSIGTIMAGPLAGLVATALGWRWAFFVSVLPTVVLLGFATRLREPRVEVAESPQIPIRFRASFHELRRKATLRRLWLLAFLYGGAFIPFITSLLSIFLEAEHGFEAGTRGLIFGLYGLGGVGGLFVGSGFARAAFLKQDAGLLIKLVGVSILVFCVGLVLLTLSPTPAVVALVLVIAVGTNAYLAPYTTLIALVTPRRLRSQGYTYSLFFFALGGIIFGRLGGLIVGRFGLKETFWLLAIPAALAGLGALSSTSLVDADLEDPSLGGSGTP